MRMRIANPSPRLLGTPAGLGLAALVVGFGAILAVMASSRSPLTTRTVDAVQLTVSDDGVRLLEGSPFTGIAITYAQTASNARALIERTPYVDGRRHGLKIRWYPDGSLLARLDYANGRLHGIADSFWENGNRRTWTEYTAGRMHGTSTHWYREGMLFKRRHLTEGREAGLQQAWRRNGKLYANYEAKNGRNYGLNKAELCFQVGTP